MTTYILSRTIPLFQDVADKKATIVNPTRAIDTECAIRGIYANAIAPELFLTRMSEVLAQRAEAANASVAPLGHIGKPERARWE